jgi:hypothetical protein
MGQPRQREEKGSLFRVLRVKLQIQFSLIDAMLMGLKLSPSSTNKYITGTLNKGANRGKRVVFLGWNMEKGKGRERLRVYKVKGVGI